MAATDSDIRITPTSTHWGTYFAEVKDGKLISVRDYQNDPAPAIIGPGIVDAVDDAVRIRRPMIRKGWLEKGPASREGRGSEPFVTVPWDEALDMAAAEIDRVRREHGNEAIFAGSYGWASAGRFHHANSQIHRFFSMAGGYTGHVGNYSYAAAITLIPHVVGPMSPGLLDSHTTWPAIAEAGELVVMFGGLPVKNSQVTSGGVGRHTVYEGLMACHDAGVDFVNVSPLRDDAAPALDADWFAVRPNTDAALMLALAHTLYDEDLYDAEFLSKYCVGFERFLPYLTGEHDGQLKDAEWAAPITGISADRIRDLARLMASKRTMITATWSIQRAENGEQPYWLVVVLAAMLGQIGLPGGGFGLGYSSENGIGNPVEDFKWPAVPRGKNAVEAFIPVARIADMMLNPGGAFTYDGKTHHYPDTRLVHWAGGNPFHHHQDLNRLVGAFRRPDTVMVNEIWWTPMARHADIVFPATTSLERNDIAMGHWEQTVTPMHKAIEPIGESRDDYAIFTGLAQRLGFADKFTEGRNEDEWLRHLWDQARQRAGKAGFELPDFEAFWEGGPIEVLQPKKHTVLLEEFRENPTVNPLTTPSGKIEIFSEAIDGFGLDDVPGHPVWREPVEWLGAPLAGTYPLHLISNQPRTRLHSQLDSGAVSRGSKIQDREPMRMHPVDAHARGIREGDVVRVYNDRGACLAGVTLSDALLPGVVQMSTGAWYDPEQPGVVGSLCKHGNVNVLTHDRGTSTLSRAPAAHSLLVEIERYEGTPPPVTAFTPPEVVER